MKFSTYAEVFTQDHPLMKAYTDGFKKTPGFLLRDILRETGGRYEVMVDLSLRFREDLRRLANANGDSQLTTIADMAQVRIPLEHLRGYDPDSTRIVYGCRLEKEPGDSALPGDDTFPGRDQSCS